MMKEILINVSKETRMVDLTKSVIGNDGENLQGKLVFTFIDEFVNGQARLEYETKGNRNYVLLDKEDNTYTIPIKNVITKEGQIDMQLVITEGTNEEEIPVFKSNKFYLYCNASINAVDEAPAGYELWIEQANTKLNEIDNLNIYFDYVDGNVILTIVKKDGSEESVLVSSGGVSDYEILLNLPKINGIEIKGNKSLESLGIQPKGNYLEQETDPSVPTHVKNITTESINSWNNKANISDIPTKTSELTNDSNFAVTNENNNFSASQTINGTLTVNGNIVQNGESYETHAEKVYTKDDEIITRDGAVGGLSDGEYTGILAQLYDGENNGRLGFNANGEARVGDIGDEQPLLTRDEVENLTTGQVLVWNGLELKAVGSSDYIKKTDVSTQNNAGVVKMWASTEDGEIGLNISTEE